MAKSIPDRRIGRLRDQTAERGGHFVFFLAKHGPQVEDQPAAFNARHYGRVPRAQGALRFHDTRALDRDEPWAGTASQFSSNSWRRVFSSAW